ncbi:MAG: efflux RND transporter periplasmic adaptor subunit [Phycisphaerales bacterium]|nr:efflux RND transporter periplasmic adaptor subunit [Phycisphaerales bacterium]
MIRKRCVTSGFVLVFLAATSGPRPCGAQSPANHTTDAAKDQLAQRDPNRPWCGGHGVYEDECSICHPELKERKSPHPGGDARGDQRGALPASPDASAAAAVERCEAHGIAKDVCTRCNPALVESFKKAGDWCAGHGVPESQCTKCNAALRERIATEFIDTFAGLPRSQRPPSPACANDGTKVRLVSEDIGKRTGLTFSEVARQPLTHFVTCNAEVAYDGNRFAHLSSPVPGVVREARVDLGTSVTQGNVLAVIDSPELAAAKADLLQAISSVALHTRSFERESKLEKTGLSPMRDVQEIEYKLSEATIAESRAAQRLRLLGLSEEEVRRVGESGETSSLLSLTAPFAGEVVERSAVIGEAVETSRMLFSVADTARMWAMLDWTEPRVRLRVGMPVLLQVEGFEGESFTGRITWVSTKLEPRTRTLKARAEFENPDGILKANMFGRTSVQVRDNESALVLPKDAVQWDGCCNVVFVREDDSTFELRRVRLGPAPGNIFEVRDGVREGEQVVVVGSFLLKTEVLKGEIGAGCCPVDFNKKK